MGANYRVEVPNAPKKTAGKRQVDVNPLKIKKITPAGYD
jgi:hypothetical protein